MSFSVATKYGARNCNNNDKDSTADFCSNDQLPRDSDTLSSYDELLKPMVFSQLSFMAKYIHEYAAMKCFFPVDKCKEYFTSKEFSESFTIKSHDHSLESNTNQNKKHSRREYYYCSSKSHGHIKGTECCFFLSYFWDARNSCFVFSSKGSNLSHNHQQSSQSTVVDGRAIVNMEYSLTPDKFHSIKDQSCCHVNVSQMRVNLEEYFPDNSFSSPMLYQVRDKFLKEKYGPNGHNLQDLFIKGERI